MKRIVKLQIERIKRQKLIWLYVLVMAILILSNGLQFSGNPTDENSLYYAGGLFPISCIQSHIDIVGPLFIAFICAILICGEKSSGMFKQPLLNGISKFELIMSKIISLAIITFLCLMFTIIFSYIVGYVFWGSHIFTSVGYCFIRFLLLAIPHITLCFFWVLIALYMPNIPSMMCISLIIVLSNNLFSQFFAVYLSKIDFMYYFYAYSEYNGVLLKNNIIVNGLATNIITCAICVYLISYRMKHMRF